MKKPDQALGIKHTIINTMNQKLLAAIIAPYLLLAHAEAQKLPLFGSAELLGMVDRSGDLMYNQQFGPARAIIDSLEERLPRHPIVPMMRAMCLAWSDQPLRTSSPIYPEHEKYLFKTIALSRGIGGKDGDSLEAMFFGMSAHGLLTEYYAQEGNILKVMSHAKQTYGLVKKTMGRTAESPELLFLSGLYNYFREKYPKRHPIYKPFVSVFRPGDIKRGLAQLDSAVHHSKIVKTEAGLYLAYIWLRYEDRPHKARYYLERLHKTYPANDYFKAKYLECLMRQKDYKNAAPLIRQLQAHPKPYFQMCGEVFNGAYLEKAHKSLAQAKRHYLKGLAAGNRSPDRGEYYRGIAYLGLGRIAEANGATALAAGYYEKTIDMGKADWLTEESKARLRQMGRGH